MKAGATPSVGRMILSIIHPLLVLEATPKGTNHLRGATFLELSVGVSCFFRCLGHCRGSCQALSRLVASTSKALRRVLPVKSPALSHSQTRMTCTRVLRAAKLARANLHENLSRCQTTSQLARANLRDNFSHRQTCTSQLARESSRSQPCTSQLARESSYETCGHEGWTPSDPVGIAWAELALAKHVMRGTSLHVDRYQEEKTKVIS